MTAKSNIARLPVKPNALQALWVSWQQQFNKGVVSAYKLAGFVLLTLILVGMFSYLTVSGFFLFSDRWAVPSILTPNNDKVVQAQLAWLSQRHDLEKIEAEAAGVRYGLKAAERASAAWGAFGAAYESALGTEAKHTPEKLAAVEGVAQELETSADSPALEAKELDRQLKQGLVTREEHARLKALAASAAVDRAERRHRALELRSKADGLRGLGLGIGLDVDGLMRRRPLLESQLETEQQTARVAALQGELKSLEALTVTYRDTVERMRANPFVRAADGDLAVAFVPYSNLAKAKEGAAVYDCYLVFFACRKVGVVKGIVGGELTGDHPVSGRDLRGRMVEMQLDDAESAQARSLVLARPPFFL